MHNHDQKARDMARSVLPSKGRQRARKERRLIHHSERRGVRVALHTGRRLDPELVEVPARDRSAIWEFVIERRYADKLGPLTRWAERTVATDPALSDAEPLDRLDHFRDLLPDNKIGRHAVSHVAWSVGVRERHRWRFDSRPAPVDLLPGAIELILAAGANGDLNRAIKATVDPWRVEMSEAGERVRVPHPWVLLGGRDDADRFLADVRGRPEAEVVVAFASAM